MKPTLTLLTALLLAPLADKLIGFTACADWPRIELKAGETKTVIVTTDSKVK